MSECRASRVLLNQVWHCVFVPDGRKATIVKIYQDPREQASDLVFDWTQVQAKPFPSGRLFESVVTEIRVARRRDRINNHADGTWDTYKVSNPKNLFKYE